LRDALPIPYVKANLKKAGYEQNPLEDGSLSAYRVISLDISALTVAAVESFGLGTKDALRSKNMWTLGLVLWLFGRDYQPTVEWRRDRKSVVEGKTLEIGGRRCHSKRSTRGHGGGREGGQC